jgi:hypothetical protein
MRRGSMVTIEQEDREPWRWPDASRRETEFLGQRQSGRNGCEGSRTPLPRQNLAKQPAHSGVFGENREISVSVGVRGGPGRTRTSNQAIMSLMAWRDGWQKSRQLI